MRNRRLAALGTATLLAVAAPGAIVPGAASAATADKALFYTVDTNGDDSTGIARALADATQSTVIAESATTHYEEIDVSPVGETVAYTRYVGNAIGLYLDNRQLTSPRLLFAAHLEGTGFHIPYYPSFSPDGTTVLFSVFEYDTADKVTETHLETVPVTGGASTVIQGSSGLYDGSFHPTDRTRIAASRYTGDGAAVTGTLAGSSLTFASVTGTSSTDFVRFSPDGTRLVFATDKALVITTLTGTVVKSIPGNVAYPVWLDSTSVLFSMRATGATTSDIYRYTIGAAAPVQLTTTPADEIALATPRALDPAPSAPTDATAVLDGIHPVISWTPPIDGDIAEMVVRRSVGTVAPASVTDGEPVIGAGPTSVTDTAALGQTFSYSIFAVDKSGQVSAPASVTLQTLAAPSLIVPAEAWVLSTRARIPISWGAGDPADTRYRVSWGAGRAPRTWHTFIDDSTDTAAYFGSGTRTKPGTYTIRVAAVDAYGHATGYTYGRVLIPRDDTAATYSRSWTRVTSTSYWNGTGHTTRTAGATATMTFTGSKLQVIGSRCSVCGSFKVYVDGRYRGTFSSRQSTTQNRVVLYTYSAASVKTHTFRVVNVASSRHPQLRLDAFAVTR